MQEKDYLITIQIRMKRLFVVEADDAEQALDLARMGAAIGQKDTLDYDWTKAQVKEDRPARAASADETAPVFNA